MDQAIPRWAEAAHRNAAPIAFPLPPISPPFVNEVQMREADDFRPQFVHHEGLPDSIADTGVLLREPTGSCRSNWS
jgi:hypothetical protein